jgi:hypothetical protein
VARSAEERMTPQERCHEETPSPVALTAIFSSVVRTCRARYGGRPFGRIPNGCKIALRDLIGEGVR